MRWLEERGPVRPFRRDRRSDFAIAEGEEAVRRSVGQVLGTMAETDTAPGELPFRPDFGSKLHLLRHRPLDPLLEELARAYVLDALLRWEPRARLLSVSVSREEGVLVISVRFRPEGSERQLSTDVRLY